ncbi:SURP and G-patch domain-containing protein 2 [Hyperolius riggenbachi]|uniref:SURP and G-patch domain-containing protein 2 n=1 Tax=Hyperolius riggenbachi TaxID=752182 RepID=UPI0035A3D3DD
MASQRITRETFDAVVQEKMKRYGINMDQAIAETIREFKLEGASRMPMGNYDPLYKERLSFREVPRDPVNRSMDMDMRRDFMPNTSYFRELGRESSGGRLADPMLGRWNSGDQLLKEQMYREEMLARDRNLSHRNWDLDRNIASASNLGVTRPDVFREFRSAPNVELGAVKDIYRTQGQGQMKREMGYSPGSKGQKRQRLSSGGDANQDGESTAKSQFLHNKDQPSGSQKFSVEIVKWAKFRKVRNDPDLQRQHTALFRMKTETSKIMVDCFKGQLSNFYSDLCFSSLKSIGHAALKSPRIDNDLLDLLMSTNTVTEKNDFFEVIKPFDREIMILQQRMLTCANPLLLACNTFDLKQSILTDPKQLLSTLKNTIFSCRKSLVLLGQTFALATNVRQQNVLDALGLSGAELHPSDYPNYKDCFLFGKEFMKHLKAWLRKTGHKLTLKSRTSAPAETVGKEAESKMKIDTEVRKQADPNVVATLDQLLEHTKKGDQEDGEKPAFWFLFDTNSNEYKYYRHKLGEYETSMGQLQTKNSQTKKAKRSPEELAVESVRAMLYARKAQAVKKRLFHSLAFSRKRKLNKIRARPSEALKASRGIVKVKNVKLEETHQSENFKAPQANENMMVEAKDETQQPNLTIKADSAKKVNQQPKASKVSQASVKGENEKVKVKEDCQQPKALKGPQATSKTENVILDVKESQQSETVKAPQTTTKTDKVTPEVKQEIQQSNTAKVPQANKTTVTQAVKQEPQQSKAVKTPQAQDPTLGVKVQPQQSGSTKAPLTSKKTETVTTGVKAVPQLSKAPQASKKVETVTPGVKPVPQQSKAPPASKKAETVTPGVKAVPQQSKAPPAGKKAETVTPGVKVPQQSKAPQASKKVETVTSGVKAVPQQSKAPPASKKAETVTQVVKEEPLQSKTLPDSKKIENVSKADATKQSTTLQSTNKSEIKAKDVPDKTHTSASSEPMKKEPNAKEKDETAAKQEDLDVDEKTKDTAMKLAQFVAQMGPEIEEFSMQNSVNNPEFWFLHDKESKAYQFYKGKVEEFKKAEQEATSDLDDDGDLEDIKAVDEDVEMEACEAAEAPSAESAPVAAFTPMPTPARPSIARKRVTKLKVGMLPPKRVCLVDEPKVHDPVRIEYERPRGRGNRRKGQRPADLEFANKKITQHNVGFQMLSKMGWREGQGLGSSGSGIKNPIKVGTVSAGEGLGVEKKETAVSGENNFDAFRQRMMQMYKHKISK